MKNKELIQISPLLGLPYFPRKIHCPPTCVVGSTVTTKAVAVFAFLIKLWSLQGQGAYFFHLYSL